MTPAKFSRLETLVDLLHAQGDGALATHAAAMPGYPLATAVSFATDEHHRPVMLVSRLAEHTRNLMVDARASFLIARVAEGGEITRVSLVGEVRPVEDAEADLVDRYLRFHPEAERFLQLGDFSFHRFEPRRALVVGGFGKAAWIDGQRLVDAPSVSLAEEAKLIAEAKASAPAGIAILGIDAYGADVYMEGRRRRITFSVGPVLADALPATLQRELAK
jgi:putative heme iron utilization protein